MCQLADSAESSQRDLAKVLGVSVGKINYCLRLIVDRGWVKVNNFRRSDNKVAYAYLLTPSGISAKIKLAQAFLARKERDIELLQAEIASLRRQLSDDSSAMEDPISDLSTRTTRLDSQHR